MATIQQLAPQTGAVTVAIPFDTAAYPFVTLSADNLAGAETVTVYQAITPPGGTTTYTPAVNVSGAAAGLTATLPSCDLFGGLEYAYIKSATAGACGVYLTPVTQPSTATTGTVGTLGSQAANAAAISGGTISGVAITASTVDSTAIGGITPAAATVTKLLIPTPSTTAKYSLRVINGGAANDTLRIGYNLSDTLYAPTLSSEPQQYLGFESSYGGRTEMYLRYEGIGNTGNNSVRATGYVEPFYSNADRTTSLITSTFLRGESIYLQDTDQNASAAFTKTASQIGGKTAIGVMGAPATHALDVTDATYGASFGGIGITDGAPRVLVGYMGTQLDGTKNAAVQIIYSAGPDSVGGLQIGSKGTILSGISFYTSPDAGVTGLVERLRIAGSGSLGCGTTNPVGTFQLTKQVGADTVGGSLVLDRSAVIGGASTYRGGAIFSYYYAANAAGHRDTLSFAMTVTTTPIDVTKVRMVLDEGGNVGIGVTAPTAVLHLKAGTATAGTAPLKLTSGVNLTQAVDGAFEYDGANLYFTVGSTRKTVTLV